MQILTMRENDGHVTELLNSLPGPLEILEAGCGRRWPHELKMQYRLTGVDTDAEALKARVEQRKDLDVAILGDIRTVDLPESSYDVVYCGWVLEHISGAGSSPAGS
jgi:2-polyprenyl-3-methyl-5-hydroxy-6-metoxy-1,4-benzoquinol methylase